jgi:hypothetical protein
MFKIDDMLVMQRFMYFNLRLEFLFGLGLIKRRFLYDFSSIFSVSLLTDKLIAFSEPTLG